MVQQIQGEIQSCVWLHPQEREENAAWMPESFVKIEELFPMYRLSIDGLKDGMYRLMEGKLTETDGCSGELRGFKINLDKGIQVM